MGSEPEWDSGYTLFCLCPICLLTFTQDLSVSDLTVHHR